MSDYKGGQNAIKANEYSIPERLKYLRLRRRLSQKELAKIAGLSQSTIAQIESGRMDPSIKTLEKIAKALDVETAIFFTKDHVVVFDMNKLRAKYDHLDKLNPTIYKALDQVVRYALSIGFLKSPNKSGQGGDFDPDFMPELKKL